MTSFLSFLVTLLFPLLISSQPHSGNPSTYTPFTRLAGAVGSNSAPQIGMGAPGSNVGFAAPSISVSAPAAAAATSAIPTPSNPFASMTPDAFSSSTLTFPNSFSNDLSIPSNQLTMPVFADPTSGQATGQITAGAGVGTTPTFTQFAVPNPGAGAGPEAVTSPITTSSINSLTSMNPITSAMGGLGGLGGLGGTPITVNSGLSSLIPSSLTNSLSSLTSPAGAGGVGSSSLFDSSPPASNRFSSAFGSTMNTLFPSTNTNLAPATATAATTSLNPFTSTTNPFSLAAPAPSFSNPAGAGAGVPLGPSSPFNSAALGSPALGNPVAPSDFNTQSPAQIGVASVGGASNIGNGPASPSFTSNAYPFGASMPTFNAPSMGGAPGAGVGAAPVMSAASPFASAQSTPSMSMPSNLNPMIGGIGAGAGAGPGTFPSLLQTSSSSTSRVAQSKIKTLAPVSIP